MNQFRRDLTAQSSVLLDLIRYVACFIVFTGHFLEIFIWRVFGFSRSMDGQSIINIYFFKLLPDIGVMIFFVLSGFLIGYKAFVEIHEKKYFPLVDYLKNRMIRIFPALYFSLLLTVAIVAIILYFNLFGSTTYHLPGDLFSIRDRASLSPSELINCIILLPGATHLSMNGPLWSLSYEFYYYIFLSFILTFIFNKNFFQLLCLSLFVIFLPLLYGIFNPSYYSAIKNVLLLLSVWALGVFIAYLYATKEKLLSSKVCLTLAFCMLFFVFPFVATTKTYFFYQFTGGIFSAFLIMASLSFKGTVNKLFDKISRGSRYTLTLYLINFPAMLFFLSLLGVKILNFSWIDYILLFALLFLSLSFISFYLSKILENRSVILRMVTFKKPRLA